LWQHLLVSFWALKEYRETKSKTRYSQTSAEMSACFDGCTWPFLFSTVCCASASNDNKITERQITANTTAKQHDLDMLTTLLLTDRVSLLAVSLLFGACEL